MAANIPAWQRLERKDPSTLSVRELLKEKGECLEIIKLCEQEKACWQTELSTWSPTNTGGKTKEYLDMRVQDYESRIKNYQQHLKACQTSLQDKDSPDGYFPDPVPLSMSATPLLNQLELLKVGDTQIRIIEEVAVVWDKLAYRLSFSDAVVSAINENNSGKNERVESCCRDMLRRWLNGKACQPVTWEKLVEAIRDIPRIVLATEIEKNFQH